jgi:adenosylcobyric acid synthase
MAKFLFIGGTASHSGKSWMTAAVCRHLKRRGLRVAPFKAQNMSLNSFPCVEGGEIGRAQAAQAEACGLPPSRDMNPILLKPNCDRSSQVVLNGKAWRNLAARDYYRHFEFLLGEVMAALKRLSAEYEFVVIEGAGSVSEINFRTVDLVNLGLARRVHAPALLVADIDRGGVFANICGTFDLLEDGERDLVRAFAINRFRGDRSLFSGGVAFLENKTRRRCLGVFPHAADIHLDEEDGVGFEAAPCARGASGVALLKFPLASNLTDFNLLPGATLVDRPLSARFGVVILPGSKNTLADLGWLRARGLDRWIHAQLAAGARILGICGGYQMLGEWIEDPHAVESARGCAEGLGLLPVRTVLGTEKTTRVVEARTPSGAPFSAYEIHMGRTERPPSGAPFAFVGDQPEGMRQDGVMGTYLHGALESPLVLRELLDLPAPAARDKQAGYDRLADWFEANADLRLFEELYL